MPKLLLSIPEYRNSIIRPTVVKICKYLIERLGMKKNILLVMPNEEGEVIQYGSTIKDGLQDSSMQPEDISTLHVEVNEEFTDDMESLHQSLAYNRDEDPYMWKYEDFDCKMIPHHSSMQVTLSLKYTSASRSEAIKWQNTMRTKFQYANLNRTIPFEIDYHYIIPYTFMEIFKEMYDKCNHLLLDQSYEDFNDWFFKNGYPTLSTISNSNGKAVEYINREHHTRVHLMHEFDTAPEQAERNKEGVTYTSSINFYFVYDKATSIELHYPLFVHNRYLDDKFYFKTQKVQGYRDKNSATYSNRSNMVFEHFSNLDVLNSYDYRIGINLPHFDDFKAFYIHEGTLDIYNALVQVQEDNLNNVFNMYYDIADEFSYNPIVIDFIEQFERPHMTYPYNSLFGVSLYCGLSNMVDHKNILIDDDWNVTSKVPLSMKYSYHVRFYIVEDLQRLSMRALESLFYNGDYYVDVPVWGKIKFYEYILYWLCKHYSWDEYKRRIMNSNGKVAFIDFFNFIHNKQPRIIPLVQKLLIVTRRKDGVNEQTTEEILREYEHANIQSTQDE